MIPRWTFPCDNTIKHVEEGWMLGDATNSVTPVRKEHAIHKIHDNQYDYEGLDEIDLDDSADAIQKTESRLLIRPELRGLRRRASKNEIGAENVVNVSDEKVDEIIDSIESRADRFRASMLSKTIPLLLGYDIAAGESEAIVRDLLKTDIEIDDELVGYISRVTVADMIGETLSECPNVPESVRADVLKDWLIKSFDGVRTEQANAKKSGLLHRLKNDYENMIATGKLGTSRGLSNRG